MSKLVLLGGRGCARLLSITNTRDLGAVYSIWLEPRDNEDKAHTRDAKLSCRRPERTSELRSPEGTTWRWDTATGHDGAYRLRRFVVRFEPDLSIMDGQLVGN